MSARLRLLPALLLLSACAKSGPSSPEARGRGAFASYDCKRCHRVGYEGGDTGPDLTFVGFRKTPEFLALWLKAPSAWQPNTMMPQFGLGESGRTDIAAYLSTLKGEAYRGARGAPWDAPELKADPKKRGADVFKRAGCVTCHGAEGKGGYVNNNAIGGHVPAVYKAAEGFTREELVKRISDGVRYPTKADPNGERPMLYMPAWKEALKPDEIEAVADYVLSLAPPRSADGW